MSNLVQLYCWHAVHLEQADRVAGLIAEFHDQYPDDCAGTPFEETAQA